MLSDIQTTIATAFPSHQLQILYTTKQKVCLSEILSVGCCLYNLQFQ